MKKTRAHQLPRPAETSRRRRLNAGLCTALAFSLALVNPQGALSCSFDSEPYFTYTNHPDLPLTNYAAGQLGILQNGYARSYLLVAYRYLSGAPLSADEQKAALALWKRRLTATDFGGCNAATSSWLKARATVAGASQIGEIATERPVKPKDYQTYCNCQTDAFETAAKTLKKLTDKFGASSNQVKEWLEAQDQVFSDCGFETYSDKPHKDVIPKPLDQAADKGLRQNRDYQIASANFYAQNFDLARKQFQDIAADETSPWQQISGYLAVRAMIREATLSDKLNKELLKEAAVKIGQMENDKNYEIMRSDLNQLKSFIAARLTPEEHIFRLAKEKITEENLSEITVVLDNLTGENSDDETPIDYSKLPQAVKKVDSLDWIFTVQSGRDPSTRHAVEKWKQTHALPWLVAAAMAVDPASADARAILEAAKKIQSGPARYTLLYNVNRINIQNDKDDIARADLDKIINNPPADLPAGALNQLKTQRLVLSRNLAEFVRYAVQSPLAICSNGGCEQVPDDIEDIFDKGASKRESPEFTFDAGDILTRKLPLSVLAQLAANQQLPLSLRNNVGFTAFVRAVLVGDETQAKALAQIVKPLNKKKEALFNAYLSAATPESKKFAGALLMLHYSSAQPCPTTGPLMEDGYGDASGWWWGRPAIPDSSSGGASNKSEGDFDPVFLTDAEQNQAAAQIAKLNKVESAPNYLSKIVLAYAKAHPQDARVPEALHLAVKCTRYGVTDDSTQALSKQAFHILHTTYKSSNWTKETPYYY